MKIPKTSNGAIEPFENLALQKKSRIDYVEANWHLIGRLRNEAETFIFAFSQVFTLPAPYSDLAKNEIRIEVVMNEDGYEFSLSDSGNGIPDDIDANSTKTLERNIGIQV